MFATQNKRSLWLLALAAVIGITGQALGQRPGREGPARPEARGVIKEVNAAAGTITVSVAEGRQPGADKAGDKTFTLAKDVEVAVAVGEGGGRRGPFFKEGKLADLAAGTLVSLALSADQKVVESIMAEGPLVRGILKSLDAANRMLTVTLPPTRRDEGAEAEEKSYPVAKDAEIAVDDGRGRRFSVKEGTLAALAPGALVTLRLSLDQKQVVSLQAEGPNLYGVIKALDPGKFNLTLVVRSREGEEEKTFVLATDAVVFIDNGKGRRLSVKQGKLADVPVGAAAGVKLTVDQKFVTLVRAEGPSMPARIKAVDAAGGTLTALFGGRGEDAQEKTWPVAKDVRITIDGKEGKLADLKPGDDGPFAMLRFSLDQKTIQAITVNNRSR